MAPLAFNRHPELVSGSIHPVARNKRLKSQTDRQVVPIRIFALDQVDLPLSVPTFELLLTSDRSLDVAECLEADEPVDVVSFRKAVDFAVMMLPKSCDEVACYADVKRAVGLACEDVDARVAFERHGLVNAEGWMLKQVQHDGKRQV